ncbi:hypothetical protein KEJ23_07095 [Candidatus Bathyarchaeota archaeon]|nr:hypothetical protein [Candidatus Bathyarchaeota archaeon]
MPSPEIPIIIPLILIGIVVGNLIRKERPNVGWRGLGAWSVIGGLGNLAHAALLYYMQGQDAGQSGARQYFAGQSPTAPSPLTVQASTGPIPLLIGSFLAGAFTVMLVFLVAHLTLKMRGREIRE